MKIETRQIHISWLAAHAQTTQDQPQSGSMFRLNTSFASQREEALQALVAKASNHVGESIPDSAPKEISPGTPRGLVRAFELSPAMRELEARLSR